MCSSIYDYKLIFHMRLLLGPVPPSQRASSDSPSDSLSLTTISHSTASPPCLSFSYSISPRRLDMFSKLSQSCARLRRAADIPPDGTFTTQEYLVRVLTSFISEFFVAEPSGHLNSPQKQILSHGFQFLLQKQLSAVWRVRVGRCSVQ